MLDKHATYLIRKEMAATRPQRVKRNPKHDAIYYCSLGEDKEGFEKKYFNSFKGWGVFSCRRFQKGDFLIEKEQENRLKVYHDALKISKKLPGQAADLDACGSLSGNTPEISKEMPGQAADLDACGSLSGNTPEISKEMPGQAADLDACGSLSGNTPKISKEMPGQAADLDACGTLSGNTPEISKEMPGQAADLDACGSLSGNTPEVLQDITGSAGLLMAKQPVEELPGMSVPLSQARSKRSDAKGKEPNRKLRKDKELSRRKNTDKHSASLESARRAKKYPWSPVVAAVMRHFGKHIIKGKLATMIECQQCKKAEDPALAGRSIQNIRDFVRNRGATLKRKQNTG
ncbi:hypothetical protein CRENBAI_001348 [Crenichthys baileyi]|uniref:Uncharacterized protein n=1 Tax=Crenichthys baileyi TaxID=28760 RepID=A0AAV9QUP2_9TELE